MKIKQGDVALITGASRGLGAHIARALAARGVNLVLAARSLAALEPVAQDLRGLGVQVRTVGGDVGDAQALAAVAEAAVAAFGSIDILVNNAGVDHALRFDLVETDSTGRVIDINLAAPMLLCRVLLPTMLARGRGHIVNIASIAGVAAGPYEELYIASKHGLVGFSRSLRLSARDLGWPVGVSVVCPGFMEGAGIYDDMQRHYGVAAPRTMGSLPAPQVGAAVVRCIERDLPDAYVMRGAPRLVAALQALAPRLYGWLTARLDTSALFRQVAAAHAREAESGSG